MKLLLDKKACKAYNAYMKKITTGKTAEAGCDALPLRKGYMFPKLRRFIVESFPLFDGADMRYCRGIHTVTLRALDNGERRRVAGHWCQEEC